MNASIGGAKWRLWGGAAALWLGMLASPGAGQFYRPLTSLSNPLPELAVALWDAARGDEPERLMRLQLQFSRLARGTTFGPMLACLEVFCRHRGLLERMLPRPLRPLEAAAAQRVIDLIEEVGILPETRLAATHF